MRRPAAATPDTVGRTGLREAEFGSVQARTALVGVVTGGSRSALQDVR
jgi:hypothetical protein